MCALSICILVENNNKVCRMAMELLADLMNNPNSNNLNLNIQMLGLMSEQVLKTGGSI